MKLEATVAKKTPNLQNLGDSDSDAVNTYAATTSIRIKSKTNTQKHTPLASRSVGFPKL